MVGPGNTLQLVFQPLAETGRDRSFPGGRSPLVVGLEGPEVQPDPSVLQVVVAPRAGGDTPGLVRRIERALAGDGDRERQVLLHSSLWRRCDSPPLDLPTRLLERGFKRVAILLDGETDREQCDQLSSLLAWADPAVLPDQLLEQMPMPACLVDGRGGLLRSSPAWRELASELGEEQTLGLIKEARERVPTWGGAEGPVVVAGGDRWFEVWRGPFMGRWDPTLWLVMEATARVGEVVNQRQAKLWLENLIASLNSWVADPVSLARSFCRQVAARSGMEQVLLFQRRERGDYLSLVGGHGEGLDRWQGVELPLEGATPMAWVARSGKSLACRTSSTIAGVSMELVRSLGVASCTCLPLTVQGQAVGVLMIAASAVERSLPAALQADLEVACLHAGVLLYAGALYRNSQGAAADWERVFDAVDQPMLLLDAERLVIRANQAATRLTDAAGPADLAGGRGDLILYGDPTPPDNCLVTRVLKSGRTSMGYRVLGRHRERYHMAVHPLPGPGGAPVGAVVFARNVSRELDLEGRFRGMVDNANALFVVTDPWGGIQFAAGIWDSMLGYSPGEVLGRNICDFVHRHDRTKVVEALARLGAKPGRVRDVLYRAPHRGGGIRWHQITGYSEADTEEVPERVYLFVADVTEHVASREKSELKKAELRQQRDMMARFLAMGAAIHEVKELQPKLELVCRAVAEAGLFRRAVMGVFGEGKRRFRVIASRGVSPREASLVEEVDSYIGPDPQTWDVDHFRISNSLFIPRESRLPGEVSCRSSSSWERADRWEEEDLLVVPLRNADGRIIGMLVVDDPPDGRRPGEGTVRALELLVQMAVSAVEHSLLQEDVDRWEHDWETVFAQVDELVAVVDREGRVVRTNRALADFLETTTEGLLGQPAPSLLRAGERDGSDPLMDTLLTGCSSSQRIEWQRRRLHVNIRPWSGVGEPAHGRGAIWVARFSGEPKISSRLEAVGSLAGGIVHDFNNMLCAIQGHISLMILERDEQSQSTHALRQIEQACVSASKMVNRLRNFSRSPGSEKSEVDLSETLRNTVGVLRHTIPATIVFQLDLPPYPIWVRTEEGAVDELVANLIINARDAMGEEGTITIGLTAQDGQARLVVSDTGVGIPAEDLAHIFDPWFTTKEDKGGSGLGLAMVKGVVQDMGGQVAVRSALAQGTVFEITLPVLRLGSSSSLAEAPGPGSLPRGNGETVLVVDDEEPILALVCDVLQYLGYRYLAAGDAQEALKVFKARCDQIDLVLTDFTMPGMTGRELAQLVKNINPDVPVILSSGLLPEAVGGGPEDDFLSKPFQVNDVARCLAAFLKR